VSANTNGLPGNAISRKATMTPDGRFVAFLSSATDLAANDTNNLPDVFVRDMVSRVTKLASADTGRPAAPASAQPVPELVEPAPEITPDGRSVAFQQTTSPNNTQVFVRDLLAQTTLAVSTESLTLVPSILGSSNQCRFDYAISDDSKYVVFEASPIASGAGVVFRYGLAGGSTEVVFTNAAYLSDDDRSLDLSSNGQVVVFDAGDSDLVPNDNNHSSDVFLTALTAGTTELISARAPELPSTTADASSELWPQSLSSEGRFLVFSSAAANLVDNDTNGFIDVFVRDLVAGSNVQVSTSLASDGADGPSSHPAISSDGRYVAFDSIADNLVTGDTNHAWDVFVRDLSEHAAQLRLCSGVWRCPCRAA
jgi:Tol biopolymer transport system component